VWAIAVLLVLPLAAFGGRAEPSAWTLCAGAAAAALALRVRLNPAAGLDRALLLVTAVLALQTTPLPGAVVDILSPHARPVAAALTLLPNETTAGWRTLSIDAHATRWAAAVWLGAVLLFLAARRQFAAGGLRQAARIVAAIGLAVSLLGIAQAATGGRAMAWLLPTPADGARPFGPFVNRNHFATWVIMALPLTLGYIAAHARAHAAGTPAVAHVRARVAHLLDPRLTWLALAAGMMLVALLLSLSRSGVLALGASTAAAMWMARGSLAAAQRRWALTGVLALVLFGALWSDVPALADRVAHAPASLADRFVIWRETRPIVRDFLLTGTGAGTYQPSMFVYQQSDRAVYFNQAHNHYLQVAAEGGLLLSLPLCLAAAALVALVRRRLVEDLSGLRFVRIGAACGLGAVALQSVWETGLVMPANAALAAVLAAVAAGGGRNGRW
jgi:hypothetical protein